MWEFLLGMIIGLVAVWALTPFEDWVLLLIVVVALLLVLARLRGAA